MKVKKENVQMVDSIDERYVVDEKGNASAVILSIEDYKKS